MRLIDADELVETMCDDCMAIYCGNCRLDVISSAPTVEAIKHGRWISMERMKYVRCSACGSDEDAYFINYAYCPHCGAKMDLK